MSCSAESQNWPPQRSWRGRPGEARRCPRLSASSVWNHENPPGRSSGRCKGWRVEHQRCLESGIKSVDVDAVIRRQLNHRKGVPVHFVDDLHTEPQRRTQRLQDNHHKTRIEQCYYNQFCQLVLSTAAEGDRGLFYRSGRPQKICRKHSVAETVWTSDRIWAWRPDRIGPGNRAWNCPFSPSWSRRAALLRPPMIPWEAC